MKGADSGPVPPPRRHAPGSPPVRHEERTIENFGRMIACNTNSSKGQVLVGHGVVSGNGDVPSLSPMHEAQLVVDHAPPREQSVEEIARRIVHDEQIPLLLPVEYCEALFDNCAGEEASRLLRSVYNVHEIHGCLQYVLDQRDVNPHDLSEKSARVMLALRAAALAVKSKQEEIKQQAAIVAEVEDDPATRRRIIQQEKVIALQNRKIQELQARAAHIKEAGHSVVGNPATIAELQDAQARLNVLKAHAEQQAADIQKLQADTIEAEKQLAAGATINRSIKSLWSDSKLTDENARLVRENEYTQRQIDIKAQHVTEVKFHLDQLKEMYDSTEHLVKHEGGALSNILTQKEAEAERLKARISRVQEEIKTICPKKSDKSPEEFRSRDLQARSRFSEAIAHVNQLEQKLDGLKREILRQSELYELKQQQLLQARKEVSTITSTVQGTSVIQHDADDYTDVTIASPCVPSQKERVEERLAALRPQQPVSAIPQHVLPQDDVPDGPLRAGETVMAFASYQVLSDLVCVCVVPSFSVVPSFRIIACAWTLLTCLLLEFLSLVFSCQLDLFF